MGKSLPVLNFQQFGEKLGLWSGQVTPFSSPDLGPGDGRTVDDFKPYLIALNLTKRCNLKCDHCYLDATTKASGGSDELSTEQCFTLIDQIADTGLNTIIYGETGVGNLLPEENCVGFQLFFGRF